MNASSSAPILSGRHILLIVTGGIAAVKVPELVRMLRGAGAEVTPVMTRAAEEFVTPLSLSVLAGREVHRDLFDISKEAEIGHIQLSRAADLVLVAPATANLMAKMAQGICDDLASTLLLATDTPVLLAPAMNVRMWTHAATRRNHTQLVADGIAFVGPDDGAMACGEFGPGRMAEPEQIMAAAVRMLCPADLPLAGKHVLVTSGPTHEPIDPVRYIANRSSGAQGSAIAAALAALGARVSFVTGPADVPPPAGVEVTRVETAAQMLAAAEAKLPADAAVFAAAVADWRVANAAGEKMKKDGSGRMPELTFAENPDILARISRHETARPPLVIGFAAETEKVEDHARAKRARKGCDWILANDVSPETGIMGGTENAVILITETGTEHWDRMGKDQVARRLAARIAAEIGAAHSK